MRIGSELDVSLTFESAAEAFTASGQVPIICVGRELNPELPAGALPVTLIGLCVAFFFAQQSWEAEEAQESPVTEVSVKSVELEIDA